MTGPISRTEPPWLLSGNQWTRWLPATLVVAAACVVHFLRVDGWVGHVSYLTVTVGASVAAWVAAWRFSGAWRVWLAVGVSASALADVMYRLYVVIRGFDPDVSAADAPWIASYIGVGLAMLLLLRVGQRSRSDVDGLIDMTVIVLAAGLVLWEFWLQDTFADDTVSWFVRSVWATYPICDAMLLTLVIRLIAERRTHSRTGLLLAGGVSCWLVADFSFLVGVPEGTIITLLEIGWMLGAALLAAASWGSDERASGDEAAEDLSDVGKVRIVLAIVPLLVPGVIELVTYWEGKDPNPIPLLLATLAFAALAVARGLRLLRLRDEARTRLASSERLYRALAANSSDAVLILDGAGWITNDAPQLAALVGHPGAQTRGHRALDFVAESDTNTRDLFNEALLSPGIVLDGELEVRRPDGSEVCLATRAVNLLDDPDVRGIVVNVHDITSRKEAERELIHQAFHDSLTGLANRALFRDRVEHGLARGRGVADPAVIYLDLDGFKNVNDGLGHDAGDALLREVASRLLGAVRSGDTVARLGGDEFAILVEEAGRLHIDAEAIAERALESFAVPVIVDGHDIVLSASIGIAHGDEDSTASSILRDADVAMYQAKTTGKGRWVVYEPTMRATALERLQLEADLARAIAEEQFELRFQPVVQLATSQIVGFEALVRWQHPTLGTIMPDQFIPIAEENGMIVAIGRWVLDAACATAARWLERWPDLTMGVNVSGRQFGAPELLVDVRAALERSALRPSALVLEMTETALVGDPVQAATRLRELRTLGVRLAIDDFGTGYSSLSYLRQFPVDILKIDRSFVNTITDPDHVPAIVRALLDLGRTLELETVAEGIETDVQFDQLRAQQCRLGQGFLFAKPLSVHDAEHLLRTATPAVSAPNR